MSSLCWGGFVGVVEDSLADAVNDGVGEFVGNVPFSHMAFRVLAPTATETLPNTLFQHKKDSPVGWQ